MNSTAYQYSARLNLDATLGQWAKTKGVKCGPNSYLGLCTVCRQQCVRQLTLQVSHTRN